MPPCVVQEVSITADNCLALEVASISKECAKNDPKISQLEKF